MSLLLAYFNGIAGVVNAPGQIPWPFVAGYFIIALIAAALVAKRQGGLSGFTTLDWVYMGVGGAFAVVWDFYLGSFIGRAIPSTPFFDISFIGRFLITMITVGVVRKFGAGMITTFIFNLLADLFHYGFGGEPVYFVYEALTYGLFFDIMIAVTGGNLFCIEKPYKSKTTTYAVMLIEGAVIGYLYGAVPYSIFWLGFFAPFVYGGVVNWARIYFLLWAYGVSNVPVGAIGAWITYRIAKAVGV